MRPRLIAVDDPRPSAGYGAVLSASMRPRLIAVDDPIVSLESLNHSSPLQ